jgi:hypothetical protein
MVYSFQGVEFQVFDELNAIFLLMKLSQTWKALVVSLSNLQISSSMELEDLSSKTIC